VHDLWVNGRHQQQCQSFKLLSRLRPFPPEDVANRSNILVNLYLHSGLGSRVDSILKWFGTSDSVSLSNYSRHFAERNSPAPKRWVGFKVHKNGSDRVRRTAPEYEGDERGRDSVISAMSTRGRDVGI